MEDQPVAAAAGPVRIVVDDDLRRSRLTVFFRLLLAIPHFVWLLLWSVAAFFAAVANWFATLVTAVPPSALHRFLSAYVRYSTHVYAFASLAANPFPGFVGRQGSYPVDVELEPPSRQNRWTVLFRLFLVTPASAVNSTLTSTSNYIPPLIGTAAFLGWFAALVRGRMPDGFRDAQVYALRYGAHTWAYTLLLTDRYPTADPAVERSEPARDHPIALELDDDLRRSRLTVFFRLLLAIPHFVWLYFWSFAAQLTLVAAWFAALVTGQAPDALHRFHAAFLRYQTQVYSYLALVANPFPGFLGEAGYPVALRVAPRERQRRWTVLLRIPLVIPAAFVLVSLWFLLFVAAFLGWFASLVLGRMPNGLRNAGAYAIRYSAQTYGYIYLLTDRYPFSGPPA